MFDDIIADMESNKKLSLIVAELFLRERKLNISLVFISQSYFKVPKTIILYATHYHENSYKRELQQIASNNLFDIDFKYFMKILIDYTKEPYSILLIDTTLLSVNPLRFRKNLS